MTYGEDARQLSEAPTTAVSGRVRDQRDARCLNFQTPGLRLKFHQYCHTVIWRPGRSLVRSKAILLCFTRFRIRRTRSAFSIRRELLDRTQRRGAGAVWFSPSIQALLMRIADSWLTDDVFQELTLRVAQSFSEPSPTFQGSRALGG